MSLTAVCVCVCVYIYPKIMVGSSVIDSPSGVVVVTVMKPFLGRCDF